METGIGGLPAPPLEHVRWIDENGDDRSLKMLTSMEGLAPVSVSVKMSVSDSKQIDRIYR